MSGLIFMVAMGIITIVTFATHIRAILACTIEMTGTYIKYNTIYNSRGKNEYEPVFLYYIRGEEFQGRCLNQMNLSDIQKQFVVGQTYTIYVSKRDSGYFAISRKVSGGDVIGILVGIGLILLGVC